MTARRILVIIGQPFTSSLNHELAHSYVRAAEVAGGEVRVRDLAEDSPSLPAKRDQLRAPNGDLAHLEIGVTEDIEDLRWAEHVVVFFPQWWGTYPAVLKNWIDRTFLSGVAFNYGSGSRWEKLLSGRTARLVMTHDSPGFYNLLAYRDAGITALRTATLGYSGIKTVGVTRFSPVKGSTPEIRAKWLAAVTKLGKGDGRIAGSREARRAATVADPTPAVPSH